MARPKKYLDRKDIRLYLEATVLERAIKRAKFLNLSFVDYVQKLMADDLIVWEHEERQKLLKSLKGEQ